MRSVNAGKDLVPDGNRAGFESGFGDPVDWDMVRDAIQRSFHDSRPLED